MSGVAALTRRVEEHAKRTATAVRLQDLYKVGKGNLAVRLRFARFLHEELAVRNAQLCKELCLLPFGLAATRGVKKVISHFSSYVDMLSSTPEPQTAAEYEGFTRLLEDVIEDKSKVVHSLREGVLEVRKARGLEQYENIRAEVDLILNRFFMKRIGMRFLIQHHIEAAKELPGVAGIIHDNVNLGEILQECAAEARSLCEDKYGCAPDVQVVGGGSSPGGCFGLSENQQFTYVPLHIRLSCAVLLQNACFAVADRCTRTGDSGEMPPVRAVFAHGADEVTVKVSDEGGGVSQDDIQYVWSYFSAPGGSQGDPGRGHRHSAPLGPLKTVKAGLPLARLHARYYGGDLILKPVQGLGTDAYLLLNRLGQNCENLPHGVRVSPAMSDSSLGDEASINLESLGTMSEFEVAFLKRRLKAFRTAREEDIAYLNSLSSAP